MKEDTKPKDLVGAKEAEAKAEAKPPVQEEKAPVQKLVKEEDEKKPDLIEVDRSVIEEMQKQIKDLNSAALKGGLVRQPDADKSGMEIKIPYRNGKPVVSYEFTTEKPENVIAVGGAVRRTEYDQFFTLKFNDGETEKVDAQTWWAEKYNDRDWTKVLGKRTEEDAEGNVKTFYKVNSRDNEFEIEEKFIN